MQRLVTSEVRDLAGVMDSPCLLAPLRPQILSDVDCQAQLDRCEGALLRLDQDPRPLLEWLESMPGSVLLGRYFEALLGFWIRYLVGASRMEASFKILRERQVIGELDFVFEPPGTEKLLHWEAAVKFYLCTASTPEGGRRADAFLGTMTKDRLDKKLAKLFDQQLEMPHGPEGRKQLQAAGYEQSPESRLFMKGALFYPAERDWRHHPHPPEVSPGHLRGCVVQGFAGGTGRGSNVGDFGSQALALALSRTWPV